MTAYELIKRLSQYEADAEIHVKFNTIGTTIACDSCEEEVFVDGEEKYSSKIEIGDNGGRYLVYLVCMEESE